MNDKIKDKTKLAILILGNGFLKCACGGELKVNKIVAYYKEYVVLNVTEQKFAQPEEAWVLYDAKEDEVLPPGSMSVDSNFSGFDAKIVNYKYLKGIERTKNRG